MSSEQQKYDLPAGVTGRVRSAASGLYKPSPVRSKKARQPVTGRFVPGVKAGLANHGIRRPEPIADETPEPYSLPSFLGMFDLPADASESVKAVVRGQDVA
ncbi:hypothetical protein [Amycolatopsis azurea]|uniref:Uncharacterized protein n=1 Tax=Amycolatopsis azurea DSM 43854 TaxID=1238180 RepID=A0ABX3JLW8_9PSEU|nr:hypothetical protein [Amycolatopsis azurea]OOC07282.1 hypothetical protein B0293_09605 [Amycolatopsis azurea DSM 43854]